MDGDDFIPFLIALCVVVATVTLGILLHLMATTTHETRMNEIDKQSEQMIACLQTDRSAGDCRVAVYGAT